MEPPEAEPPEAKRAKREDDPEASCPRAAVQSSKGKKLVLEDVPIVCPSLEGSDAALLSFFAVLDGHGGSDCAKWAAEKLPSLLAETLPAQRESASIKDALKGAFSECDEQLLAHCREQGWDDGTCAIGLLVDRRPTPARAYCVNVGDSRAFAAVHVPPSATSDAVTGTSSGASGASEASQPRSAPLRAVPLSKDHTALDPKERKRIEAAGGVVLEGRINGLLEVSRSLGDRRLKRGGTPSKGHAALSKSLSVPTPDVTSFEVHRDQQAFVLLGCDGLWSVFSGAQAVEWLGERLPGMDRRRAELAALLSDASACAGLKAEKLAELKAERESATEEGLLRAMVHEAVHGRRAKDNVTAMLVRF